MGDKTDNISGIKGIGPIRTKKIILEQKKIKLNQKEKERISLNKKLIQLNKNVPIKNTNIPKQKNLLDLKNKEIFNLCDF